MCRRMPPPQPWAMNTTSGCGHSASRSMSARRANARPGASARCAARWRGIARIEARERRVAARRERLGLRAERRMAFVADVHVAGEKMAEAHAARAQAEIDLHAAIGAERLAVEGADAVAHSRRRYRQGPDTIGSATLCRGFARASTRSIRASACRVRQRVDGIEQGIPGRTAAIGERNDDADARLALRVPGEPVQPVVGDHRVAVQDDRVAVGVQREPAVDRGGEARARRLLDQRRAPRARELAQVADELGIRGSRRRRRRARTPPVAGPRGRSPGSAGWPPPRRGRER